MNDEYYVCEYMNDEGGNVSGIKFRHIHNTNTTTYTFIINVGEYYKFHDRRRRGIPGTPIIVVSIDDRNIYYKVIKNFTGSGEISTRDLRLGTEELFIPVVNISGNENMKPVVQFNPLHMAEGAIREGGRNKRGRKSKKYSKTKSKSRTRRGGRRSRRVRRIKCKSRR